MKKKVKLFASLASLCIALAVLCFGVYAAQAVNYSANGSVIYDVQDVFVQIDTKLYWSTAETLTADVEAPANAFKNGESVANTALATSYTGATYSTFDGGTIKNPGENVTASSGALPIKYGKYQADGDKSYAYYVVIEIKNYGTEIIHAVLKNNTTSTTLNSIVHETGNIQIDGRGTNEFTTGRIVIGMALEDPTISASGDFSYSVDIKNGELPPEPTLDKLQFQISDDRTYYSVAAKDTSISGKVVIPETYDGLPVKTIGWQGRYSSPSFRSCTGITEVIIPNSITRIELGFSGCTGLTSIKIPESVTYIGYSAFSGCTGLTSIKIPSNVTTIGPEAFYDCTNLASISIPNSVTSIGSSALYAPKLEYIDNGLVYIKNTNSDGTVNQHFALSYILESDEPLTSVTVNSNCKFILDSVFHYCADLKSVTIPSSVRSIGDYAFSSSGLTSVIISEGVNTIGRDAFSGCTSLTSITIPSSVTYIGESAFCGCKGLTEVVISEGVTYIGYSAFSVCEGLTEVTIPSSAILGGSTFYRCTNLASVTILGGVTSIGNDAFSGCTSLNSIIIPDSVTTIGESAFEGCTSLNSIIIPNSVTTIWSDAFLGCTGITSITIPSSVTRVGSGIVSGWTSSQTIYVPFKSGELPSGWNAGIWNRNCNANIEYLAA